MDAAITIFIALTILSNLVTGYTPVAPIFDNVISQNYSGERSNRVLGGSQAEPHQFPYQVAVFSTNFTASDGFCGGSLISPRHVLTAAHCIDGFLASSVVLGTNNALSPSSEGYVKITAFNRTIHPNYSADLIDYDIALLTLTDDAVLGDYIQPILLPRLGTNINLENQNGLLTGWGKTSDDPNGYLSNNILWVDVPIVDNQQCVNAYGPIYVNNRKICVATEGGSVGPCLGDSGGPMTIYDEQFNETVQIGLVSFGAAQGCTAGFPTVFTRITSYLQWIEDNGGPAVRT